MGLIVAIFGFGWWASNRPPQFPVWLKAFQSKTTLLGQNGELNDPPFEGATSHTFYLVHAPGEKVFEGMEASGAFVESQFNESFASFVVREHRVTLQPVKIAGARATLISITSPVPVSTTDRFMMTKFPGWFKNRLGSFELPQFEADRFVVKEVPSK
ncbi:MAG: hypothetical protein ABL949_16850 [Fimbriimonadaceae bacterium]